MDNEEELIKTLKSIDDTLKRIERSIESDEIFRKIHEKDREHHKRTGKSAFGV